MTDEVSARPILALGLDAFDVAEVERRLQTGSLPNIAKIAERGPMRRLSPDTPGLGGMAWVTFVHAATTPDHGWYFTKVWSPKTGQVEEAGEVFPKLAPFWDRPDFAGKRIALLDVPYAPTPAEPFAGIYLNGWQTHDLERLRTKPHSLLSELRRKFGEPILRPERYGPQSAADLLEMRRQALDAIRQFVELSCWILQRQSFDLAIMAIGAAHRAGHYLWDLSQIDATKLDPGDKAKLDDAMDDIYRALDNAVGRVLEIAKDYEVVAFAVHGMRSNPGWNDVLADILQNVDAPADQAPAKQGMRGALNSFRRSPLALRIHRNMPPLVNRAISKAMASQLHDWSRTRYFTLPSEVVGAIRINLEGREPNGIVLAGDLARATRELADKLRAIRDIETGEPIAGPIHIVDDLAPADARARAYLPDLVVEWNDRRLVDSAGIAFANGQQMLWERGRRVSSGRSGDHLQQGWIAGNIEVVGKGNEQPTPIDLAQALARRRHEQVPVAAE